MLTLYLKEFIVDYIQDIASIIFTNPFK